MATSLKNSHGISLIETLVALGIAAVAMGSIVTLVGRSVFVIGDVRQELIAANLAQEGVELVRNIRDNNWAAGHITDTAGGCPTPGSSWRNGMCDNTYRVDASSRVLGTTNTDSVLCRRNDGLLVYPPGGSPVCPSGTTATGFHRQMTLSTPPAGNPNRTSEMIVTSTVRWCRSAVANCVNQRTVTVVDHLRNWFPQ